MEEQTLFEPSNSGQGPATILVVDDSVPSANLLQLQLERAGYRVQLAFDGEEALAKVQAEKPDLIILDVMMPGLDGFTVCQQLKSEPETWFIPVILLTALTQMRDRIQGIEAGADDFLSKPFNREELQARVRSLLRLKAAHHALETERNRLALLYSISQEINGRLALDEVLGKIVRLTRQALQANMCSFLLFGEDLGARQIISRAGHPPRGVERIRPAILEEGLAGWVRRHRQGTIVDDTSQDQRWLVLPEDSEPVGSAIAAPLMIGREITGILLLTHPTSGFFDEGHLSVLTSIAAQAAITVRNAHLYEEEQQRRQELELLQAAGVAMSAELNRQALIQLIVSQGAALLDAPAACLTLIDDIQDRLCAEAWYGSLEPVGDEPCQRVEEVQPWLQGGQRSFQIPDVRRQPMGCAAWADRADLVSQLSLALVSSGRFLGLLNLFSRHDPRHFDPDEVQLAETFAQQAATALANANLLARTREERGKLSAVLSSTTDAVLAIDQSGEIVLANPAAEQTFDLPSEALLGKPLAGLVPDQLLAIFDEVSTTGEPVSSEISANGGQALYVSVAPVVGVGHVAVVQDITPLKQLEAIRLQTEQEERERIHQLFERYISPELVDRILAQEAGLLERRERRDVVVLFADLRRFSDMTASSRPHSVIEILNEFFTAMVNVVHRQQGTVFDLAGDELMVGFGAPFAQEDAVERALRTAGEMQQAFAGMRQRWQEQQGIEIGLGVGMDRGSVVMGSIGAPSHMNFGMVGEAVNTAHRMVELAQNGQILVSEAVHASLPEQLPGWSFERLPPMEIKGRSGPMQIYLARQRA
jgi:PAS domain S-box-containing protein